MVGSGSREPSAANARAGQSPRQRTLRCARRSRVWLGKFAGKFAGAIAGTFVVGPGAAAFAAHDADPEDVTANVHQLSLEELMEVKISPFDLSTVKDRGYQAFSSVTASRLDTPIKDTSFPIQAFTRTFIDDIKPATIYDVARHSPSVTYRSNDFNEGNANLAIRGFAVSSSQSGVQVLRDGFHGPPIFDFSNVLRLEIVKGPSSFLYGQVAPGGIVNIITKAPQPRLAATAHLRYGAYGAYRFEGDVTGPLRKTLLFRTVSSYDQDIRYWDPYDGRSFNVAPALLWRPNPWMTLSVKHEYYRKRETPQLMQKPVYGRQQGVVPTDADPNLDGVTVPGLPPTWNGMSYGDFRTSDTSSLSAVLDVKPDAHWNLRVGYAHQKSAIDALFTGNIGLSNAFPFFQGRRVRRQKYTIWDDTFEVNATARYDFRFVSIRLLLGAQYVARRFDFTAFQAPNDPAFGPIASPLPNWDLRDPATWNRTALPLSSGTVLTNADLTRFRDRAVLGGLTLSLLNGRLLVLGGARVTKTQSQTINQMSSVANPQFDAQKLTPQYGLLYKLLPNLSLFATYAESFVPAGVMLIVRNSPTVPAKPIHGRGVDVGAKTDFVDGRVSGTVTLFEVRNSNILNELSELDPATGVQQFTRVQSGEQRCSGVEVDVTLTPWDNWQTYLSYSYNHARFVEVSGNDAAILAAGPSTPGYKEVFLLHNAPLQMSAPHLANVWTRYELTRSRLRGLYAAAGANLVVDQTLLPDTPPAYNQTYALVNALAGYLWPLRSGFPTSVELYGKNLTNREYRPSQSTRSRPIEIGVALTVRY